MTVLSKLVENGNNSPASAGRVRLLRMVCLGSSLFSAGFLSYLYLKALNRNRNAKEKNCGKKCKTGPVTLKEKSVDRSKFITQIRRILGILVPKWICPEVGYMGLTSILLALRSLCDVWTIYLGTLLESSIIAGNPKRFGRHLLQFAMTMPTMSVVTSLRKYCTEQLKIRFRRRLTEHLMSRYMHQLTFFKLSNIGGGQVDGTGVGAMNASSTASTVKNHSNKSSSSTKPANENTSSSSSTLNVDQLITTDVDKFCSSLANLYSDLSKPLLDIFIYAYGITSSIGASVPASMLGYLLLAGGLMINIRKPMSKLTAQEQHLEGQFRYVNSRIISCSEEIAFYGGSKRELRSLREMFQNLFKHVGVYSEVKFVMDFIEIFIARSGATLVGYYAVSRPFFTNRKNPPKGSLAEQLNNGDHQFRLETYYKSGRMLVNLAQAIGRLVINGKELSRLAGYTSRINNLMDTLKRINDEEDLRMKHKGKGAVSKRDKAHIASLPQVPGRYIREDNVIRFDRVPIVTPNGDVLIEELSLEVKSGTNVLVCGPNGCGKSSLFRILGELWPLRGGVLTKPDPEKLFYVPQKPYMPIGSLRDQIIYPDCEEDMKRKGYDDAHLVELLRKIDLEWMITGTDAERPNRELPRSDEDDTVGSGASNPTTDVKSVGKRRNWDDVENWMDVLSGGQKQRLAMARLLYHKPQFAILDECTSAVSMDVEGAIYEFCRSMGITLFTVSHRKSLWQFHEYYLHMDGRGLYEFKEINENTEEFGS